MKPSARAIVGIAFVAVFAVAGGFFSYERLRPRPQTVVFMGYQTWPGVLPYLVAKDQGFFSRNGLDVRSRKIDSYVEEMADLSSGSIDFAGDIVLLDVVERASRGEPWTVVLATDYSNGADGIVAGKDVVSPQGLAGKTVAVEQNTMGAYLLYDALRKNGLGLADVNMVNLTAIEAADAFVRKEVNAAVTYEPDLSRAARDGDGRVVFSSADSPGLIVDVLAFTNGFPEQNPETVRAVIRSYFEAIDFIAKDPDRAYEIGAAYLGVTPEELRAQMVGIRQLGRLDNAALMTYGVGPKSLHGLYQDAYDYLSGIGIAGAHSDSTAVIDPQYFRN